MNIGILIQGGVHDVLMLETREMDGARALTIQICLLKYYLHSRHEQILHNERMKR